MKICVRNTDGITVMIKMKLLHIVPGKLKDT